MWKLILSLVAIVGLSGCSLLTERVAEKVAPLVVDYCEKETQAQRDVNRAVINAELQPFGHSVAITCAGDD